MNTLVADYPVNDKGSRNIIATIPPGTAIKFFRRGPANIRGYNYVVENECKYGIKEDCSSTPFHERRCLKEYGATHVASGTTCKGTQYRVKYPDQAYARPSGLFYGSDTTMYSDSGVAAGVRPVFPHRSYYPNTDLNIRERRKYANYYLPTVNLK